MTKIQQLKERMAALKAEMVAEAKLALKEAAAGLFAKYPDMESFGWEQYTIYFNDGDETTFSVYGDAESVCINGGAR